MGVVSDSGVWQRIQQGDGDAIQTLVERYERHLINYFYRVTGDPAVAELLFERTMVEAVRQLIAREGGENHKLEIFAIAHRLMGTWNDQPQDVPSGAPPEVSTESAALVRDALGELPLARREAVILKLFHKFSYAELGLLLDTTPTQVCYEVRVGISHLAEMLL